MKHVYAMARDDGAIKVGISSTPDIRRRAVSLDWRQPISVVFQTEARHDAKVVEDTAHRLLKSKHHRGEWFWVSLDEARSAILHAIEIVEGRSPDITSGTRFSRSHPDMLQDPVRVHVPMPDDLLEQIDEWRRRQPGKIPSQSEAIRQLIRRGIMQASTSTRSEV